MTPEHRKQLIDAIKSGNVQQMEELKKVVSGKKVVLSTFLDCMKFFFCKYENGEDVDRLAQIQAGEIEVEYRDPIKSSMEETISKNGYYNGDGLAIARLFG